MSKIVQYSFLVYLKTGMSQRNIDIFMALMTASYLELFFCWNLTLFMTFQLKIIKRILFIFTDFEYSLMSQCNNVQSQRDIALQQ